MSREFVRSNLGFYHATDNLQVVVFKHENIGYVEKYKGRWRGLTKSYGVVTTRRKTRHEAAYAVYCQRFGNPEFKKMVK